MTFLPRTQRNYKREVQEGLDNSIVVAVVRWVARNLPEPVLQVERRVDKLNWELDPENEISTLMQFPNPFFSGRLLRMALAVDWTVNGNAYLRKVRSQADKPVQLWYIPARMMEPHAHTTEFIDYYEYDPQDGSRPQRWDPRDVVHFRNGVDTRNIRKGMSPLASLLREIFTDDEAANFSASLLANLGVPGVIISPGQMPGSGSQLEVDAESLKQVFTQKFSGDKRGEAMVTTIPVDVKVLSWSPQQLDLKALRRVPEERVSAVTGISAMVLGLGVGLEHSTFSNYAEAREAAYENNILPTLALLADALHLQLLSDFVDQEDLRDYRVGWDLSNIRALQDDVDKTWTRVRAAINDGIMTLSEGRQKLGLQTGPEHNVYYRRGSVNVVPAGKVGDEVMTSTTVDPDKPKHLNVHLPFKLLKAPGEPDKESHSGGVN